jgi:Icc-related predicted phosphoesterase
LFSWKGFADQFDDWDSLYCGAFDILLVHQPPGEEDFLSPSLSKFILKHQPILVVCGHIHSEYGIKHLGKTVVANCAMQKGNFKPNSEMQKGILIQIENKTNVTIIDF